MQLPNIPPHVTLIAVSKKQSDDRIDAALESGLRIFGENRVQEAQKRWAKRRTQFPDLQLHLIGALQSNKAAEAVSLFDVIHTVDREKIALALREEMTKQQKDIPCFIQVNTGDEEQKSGIKATEVKKFLNFCRETGLNIIGLMCIPPVTGDPVPHFTLLSYLAKENGLENLSMGMSADFDAAVKCGATHIRLGSAIFGERL
jgi:pyridoxal phosphate enzyme (YggS family)